MFMENILFLIEKVLVKFFNKINDKILINEF